ncbi:hypothetical protein ACE0DR_10625 [Azotobacter sp. CWF10]
MKAMGGPQLLKFAPRPSDIVMLLQAFHNGLIALRNNNLEDTIPGAEKIADFINLYLIYVPDFAYPGAKP